MCRFTLLIFALILLVAAPLQADQLKQPNASLLAVLDGDTIVVRFEGHKEHVRLIGIDAPEAHSNPKAERDAARQNAAINTILTLGKRSSDYLTHLLRAQTDLYLELDRERRDRYSRILAYAYLASGEMLNEKLLSDGYATLYTFPPNVKYLERFKKASAAARQKRRGLWSEHEN